MSLLMKCRLTTLGWMENYEDRYKNMLELSLNECHFFVRNFLWTLKNDHLKCFVWRHFQVNGLIIGGRLWGFNSNNEREAGGLKIIGR